MATFTQWVQNKKSRKWLYIVGGLFFVIILFLMLRGGSKKGSSEGVEYVNTGPSEAQQSFMLQAQGMQQQSDALRLQAATEALAINAQVQIEDLKERAADRESERAYQASMASIAADKEVKLAGISSQAMIEAANSAAAVASQRLATQAMVAQTRIQVGGETAVNLAAINAAKETTLAHERNIAYGLAKAKKKHVGAILAGESPELGTKTKAITGLLGGLFSDIRMKRNIKPTGARIDGIPTYSYELVGAPGEYAGVIAQELEMMHPEFVLHTPRGLLVDYTGLDAAA